MFETLLCRIQNINKWKLINFKKICRSVEVVVNKYDEQ